MRRRKIKQNEIATCPKCGKTLLFDHMKYQEMEERIVKECYGLCTNCDYTWYKWRVIYNLNRITKLTEV